MADLAQLVHARIDVAGLVGTAPHDGALALFLGTVRNQNAGRAVLHLEYEAYEEMARALMADLAAETHSRFPVSEVRLVHRLGRLEVGEASVHEPPALVKVTTLPRNRRTWAVFVFSAMETSKLLIQLAPSELL